jgi:hypothetical protein
VGSAAGGEAVRAPRALRECQGEAEWKDEEEGVAAVKADLLGGLLPAPRQRGR